MDADSPRILQFVPRTHRVEFEAAAKADGKPVRLVLEFTPAGPDDDVIPPGMTLRWFNVTSVSAPQTARR